MSLRYDPTFLGPGIGAFFRCEYCGDPLDSSRDVAALSGAGAVVMVHAGPCHDAIEKQMHVRGLRDGWVPIGEVLEEAVRALREPRGRRAEIIAELARSAPRSAASEEAILAEVLRRRSAEKSEDNIRAQAAAARRRDDPEEPEEDPLPF